MGRDPWAGEGPEQRAVRRKNRLRLAIVAPIAILAVVVAIVAYMRNPEQSNPAPAAQVPQAFLGEWRGVADNGRDTFDIVLTIRPGTEEVATSSNTNKTTGARCERAERLVGATDTELTLAARPTGGEGCDGEGTESTVQLHTDGSLAYRAGGPGSTVTGTLHRP
ncbi:hypothetical protein [Nocardia transvalensis]|uniref:hypothetical protein n=1 Tax=Nocardia transvalensis TaxID=37333 RepID=UPI00189434F8|nr:hypothetical protein [Nocardia transvalensis]MBF6333284.1 hypothetical protein [Nocardia transvalensis]